jgi:hypothetical protein
VDFGVNFGDLQIASVSFLDEGISLLARSHTLQEIGAALRLARIREPDKRPLDELIVARSREVRAAAPTGNGSRAVEPTPPKR